MNPDDEPKDEFDLVTYQAIALLRGMRDHIDEQITCLRLDFLGIKESRLLSVKIRLLNKVLNIYRLRSLYFESISNLVSALSKGK